MENKEFLSASHDVVFKALFVRNPALLREFLKDVLDLPITDEATVTILNPELIPDVPDLKMSRLDIHVEIGEWKFNIEMQVSRKGFSIERLLFYWAEIFIKDAKTGKSYKRIRKTFSVNILGFNYCDSEDYHSSYSIWEDKRHELLTDKLSIHVFELPKVPKELISGDKKQPWMELIKADSEEALKMLSTTTTNSAIQQGIKEVCELNADVALRERIFQRDKALRDYESGMEEARLEGEARGLAKGEALGLAKGKSEGKIEALEALVAGGMDEKLIRKLLGL